VKNICLIIFILAFFLSIAYFFTVLPRRGALEKTVKHMLLLASLITLSYIFMLTARDEDQVRIAYSLKSLFTSWLLAFLLQFSVRFIDKYRGKHIDNKPLRYALILILAANSLILISNAFAPMVTVILQQWFRGELFYTVRLLWPYYYFHAFVLSALVGLNCILIYMVHSTVPKIYWQRYRALLTFFFAGTIISVLLKILKFHTIDLSVLTYGMFSYHMLSVQLHPPEFSSQIKSLLIYSYTNAILVFDSKNTLVLYNKKSSELFSLSEDMLRTLTLEEFAERNTINLEFPQTEEEGFFYNTERDGKRLYFFVRCSRIYDKKGLLVGTFVIFEDETVQRMLLGKQRFLEEHDHLTGILNRNAFSAETEALLRSNPDKDYLFIQFDIDNFRIINQLFGSRAGNALLQAIADYLKEYVKNGTYARLEADHFAVCAPEDEIDIEELSEGISKCVSRIGISLQLRASFGIYKIVDKNIPVEQMYDMAVIAAKAVKGNYWDYFAYYDDIMQDSILREQEIIGEMELALRNNQFEVFLQPQYNYTTGEIVGAEALTRWNHPEKGLILPKTFVPIFEKNGFIAQLDLYVWDYACRLLHKWAREGSHLKNMPLSINVSRVDFYKMDLCAALMGLVKKYGFDPKLLRLEVTESACIGNPEHMIDIIKKLQSYGFTVEMDDFGSGYSSLNILRNMPVNVLKLDMNFLSGEGDIEKGYNILRSIVQMAGQINLSIIAEGVENRGQADFLHSIGCDIMQGHYYSPPLRVDDFEREVKENYFKTGKLR
jgi:diguanylate cyclase (GGDEF)-like protein